MNACCRASGAALLSKSKSVGSRTPGRNGCVLGVSTVRQASAPLKKQWRLRREVSTDAIISYIRTGEHISLKEEQWAALKAFHEWANHLACKFTIFTKLKFSWLKYLQVNRMSTAKTTRNVQHLVVKRASHWSESNNSSHSGRNWHFDIDIYLTAGVHKVSEFLPVPGFCHTMDTAEVIHRKVEWELALIAQGNQRFTAPGHLVIVTVSWKSKRFS